jgi:hypothetical protein
MMMAKDRKTQIERKYKKGLIPDDLIDEIYDDIEIYLEKKSQKNQGIIKKMISTRLSKGMNVYFSEDDIIKRLASMYA